MVDPDSVVDISDDSSDESSVPVAQHNRGLLQALNSIQSAGKIATFNSYSAFVNPGLNIEGGHLISLPLKEDDAKLIKSVCHQAPFGHGDKTLVDTSVRDTWELDASKLELANPQWPGFFDGMLQATAAGLGLSKVAAKPHKLLLYEPGSFFKPHKDSEKEQGMIGTLVICLPSKHEGADVKLTFGSQVISYSTAPTSKFDLASISWFSDVTHEVTKLTSGYRLVLSYKLFIVGDSPLSASTVLQQTEHLKSMLSKWRAQYPELDRIIYPLEHLYTEASLCLENLKSRDRAVAHSLDQICSDAGFYLMLAHATHSKQEEDGYGVYDDYSEESHTTLEAMYAPDGGKVASEVSIDVDEILGCSIQKDLPDSEDEGEYTGNESAPTTFRYHKTVIVLVPKDRVRHYLAKGASFDFSSGPRAENDHLAKTVCQDLANNPDDPYTKQAATAFLKYMLHFGTKPAGETVGLISKWALRFNNMDILRACIKATYAPLGSRPQMVDDFPFGVYRKHISKELVSYLRTHFDGKEKEIDWGHWLQDLSEASNIATEFNAFCVLFRSSTDHQPLLESFGAWADPIADGKLKAQRSWTFSDQEFILNTIKSRKKVDNKWLLESFLPTIVPQAYRFLLWDVLHAISVERCSIFQNSKQLYQTIIEHGHQQLCLSELDVTTEAERDLKQFAYRTPCQKFIMMLEESYINGAGEEALGLLKQSCRRLVERKDFWSSVSAHYLRTNFLEPLIKALETHGVPPVPEVQGFFEVALRDVIHKPINTRPVQLDGWAHERCRCFYSHNCGDCRDLNNFLENPEQQEWHFPAAKPRRGHIEDQLRDPIYSRQTITGRSPHTLVVRKLGTHYDRTFRLWKEGFQAVDDALYLMRSDYLRGFLGEEKYNELLLLQKPGQEDLVRNMKIRGRGDGDGIFPNAKRARMM